MKNFNDVFDSLNLTSNSQYWELDKGREYQEKLSLVEADKSSFLEDFSLTPEDKEKFQGLGPISRKKLKKLIGIRSWTN